MWVLQVLLTKHKSNSGKDQEESTNYVASKVWLSSDK